MEEREKRPDHGLDKQAVEREARAGREFSVADAINAAGGGDLMKGASPVSRKRQAQLTMKQALREHLSDIEGALRTVLLRRLTESEALLHAGYENPMAALADYVARLLQSDAALRRLVHEADIEWGRANDTRPFFEKEGEPPHPDDPYTSASVQAQLTAFSEKLQGT